MKITLISRFLFPPRRVLATLISLVLLGLVLCMVEPTSAFKRLGMFSVGVLAALLLILFFNLLVVSFRFWRVLAHLGISLPWSVALRANMAGNVAGLFVIPLVGQVAGRQAILQGLGIPPIANASVAAYERVLLAGISGALAIWAALFLLGQEVVERFVSGLALGQIAFAATVGILLSYLLGRGRFEDGLVRTLITGRNTFRLLETVVITLTGQILMLSCFVLGFHTIAPQIELLPLFAASAIVSFAASLPISVGGWGVRELAAVYVFGLLGVPATDAMAVSVLIGVCSTLVVFGVVPFTMHKTAGHKTERSSIKLVPNLATTISLERASAWLLGFVTAVAVFFQAHIQLTSGVANLNLADPFALLALAAVILHALFFRQLPHWRVARINLSLAAISVVLLIGFGQGWLEIGVTQWALGGRLLGWLVLLGYLSAGYLLVVHHGAHGLRRLVETMGVVASVVVLLQVILRLLNQWGWSFELASSDGNFEGYAGNRNAFAFQLLAVAALLIGYSCLYARRGRVAGGTWIMWTGPLLGILLTGLVLSGSRTGIGTAVIILIGAWMGRLADRRMLLMSMATALGLWGGIWLLAQLPWLLAQMTWLQTHFPGHEWGGTRALIQASFSSDSSDHERWKANVMALQMWRDAPLLGAGLGVFFARSQAAFGFPMIIHSTPLWILAEFGLMGVAVFGAGFYSLFQQVLRSWRGMPKDRALGLLLLAFCLFSLMHEILYQRIFWLLLGVLLAQPFFLGRILSASREKMHVL